MTPAKQNPKPNNMARKIIDSATSPLQTFFKLEASSGIFLIISALIALAFANTESLQQFYFGFINTPVGFSIENFTLDKTLLLLVNDGLMAIFFFLVGLEIKRELLVGELSSPRKASFSFFAAIGGMLIPALAYLAINWNTPTVSGWGIPMATDIAFAIGVITLLGKRVPPALKVFLLALAIVDDLGAILVIAFFYSGDIATHYLGIASGCLFTLFILNHAGFRNVALGILLGCATWFCFLKSGVHATIAGVLLAFLTPAWPVAHDGSLDKSKPPLLDTYIHALHPWVAFVIMPLFAFFNAGVSISDLDLAAVITSDVSIGILLGLVIGKPVGIVGMVYLATRFKLADLPRNTTWLQIAGVGILAGIGFTMSLFVSSLAFSGNEAETASKVAILMASLLAMVLGYTVLLLSTNRTE